MIGSLVAVRPGRDRPSWSCFLFGIGLRIQVRKGQLYINGPRRKSISCCEHQKLTIELGDREKYYSKAKPFLLKVLEFQARDAVPTT